MKRFLRALPTILLLWSAGARAEGAHLIPADDALIGNYQAMLRHAFSEIYEPDIQASAIVMPNFRAEMAIAIRRRGSKYSVITLTPQIHLWRYQLIAMTEAGDYTALGTEGERTRKKKLRELRRGIPKDPKDVRFDRCERRFSVAAAERVLGIWGIALAEIRPADEEDTDEIVLDGTSFEFWMPNAEGGRRGSTYAPQSGNAGSAASIAAELIDFCRGKLSERDIAAEK